LAKGAVGFFEEAAHLGEGVFLVLEGDGHPAEDLMVGLNEFGFLGFERKVLRVVDLKVATDIAIQDGVAVRREEVAVAVAEVEVFEAVVVFLKEGSKGFDEVLIAFLSLGVFGMAGHGDVTESFFFFGGGPKLAPVEEPLFEGLRTGGGALLEFLKVRLHRLPAIPI